MARSLIKEFDEAVRQCATMEDVGSALREAIAPFGFNAAAAGVFQQSEHGPSPVFFFQDWPQGWLDIYAKRNFVAHDFVVAEARGRIEPFTWMEAMSRRSLTHPAQAVWRAVQDWGWRDGFAVPVHGPGDYFGLISMASTEKLTGDWLRLTIRILAMLAHDHCRLLSGQTISHDLPVPLTVRELECIRWVAAGKTDSEISGIMGIGVTTVKSHVESARHKLNAATRAQAVSRLALAGL